MRTSALIQLVIREVSTNTAVRALVGDRVFASYPRVSDVTKIQFPIVVVSAMSGGSARYSGALQDARLAVCVYDQTSQGKASDLYDTVFAALHTARLISTVTKTGGAKANALAGYAREVVRPSTAWSEDVGAWYSEGTWVVMVAG